MREGTAILFLGGNALLDLKYHRMHFGSAILAGGIGIIFQLLDHSLGPWDLLAVGIGVCFLLISILTAGRIGMGDGWVLIVMGLLIPFERYLIMLTLGLFLASLWSAFLLFFRKKGGNTEIPFLPFLFLAYLGGYYLCL